MSPYYVLIAHAPGEESLAERLAEPIRKAGYEVTDLGTILVGESVVEQASKALQGGGPVVLCGTVQALGTGWAHKLVNAARKYSGIRVFAVQMEQDAYLQQLTLDDVVAEYWRDPIAATAALLTSLHRYYPVDLEESLSPLQSNAAEQRYRELALESCDIIDLANLPESDRHLATRKLELRRLYVPLRVRVEAESDEDEEAALLALEQSRTRDSWEPKLSGPSFLSGVMRVPVGERLGKARRLVVLGDPGSGKSTLLRWIATAYLLRLKRESDWKDLPDVATLPDTDWLPIVIRCRDLDAETGDWTLDKVLRHTLRKSEMTRPEVALLRVVIQSRLNQGSAVLLVDGLDEIADASARARFCRQIEQIHVAYPNAPIIVTSRIVGYREMNLRIGRGFEHVTVPTP